MNHPKRRKYTLIHWNPPEKRPEEESAILMQLVDDEVGIYTEYGSYEKGKFIFHDFDGNELILAEKDVLGWSYLPFWLFKRP